MKEEGISYFRILGTTAAKFYRYLQSKETNVGVYTHTHTEVFVKYQMMTCLRILWLSLHF